jgi:hypothetical protein
MLSAAKTAIPLVPGLLTAVGLGWQALGVAERLEFIQRLVLEKHDFGALASYLCHAPTFWFVVVGLTWSAGARIARGRKPETDASATEVSVEEQTTTTTTTRRTVVVRRTFEQYRGSGSARD